MNLLHERICDMHNNLRLFSITDAVLIGDAADPADMFVKTHDNYTWYFATAFATQPRRVLELGVRFAYASIAMLQGAIWAGVRMPYYVGIDAEADGHPCIAKASDNIANRTRGQVVSSIYKLNTRATSDIDKHLVNKHSFDMIHVDGDHSADGVANELYLAKTHIAPGGLILIDDMDTERVRLAAESFCAELRVEFFTLPTIHGTMVVQT